MVLITPITIGFEAVSNFPLQLSVNILALCFIFGCNVIQYFDMIDKLKRNMAETNEQYDNEIAACKEIFIKKAIDYGTSWRVLRTISVVDQIFIKALRIRTIQEKKVQKVADDIRGEFKGIINYAVIGLIQLKLNAPEVQDVAAEIIRAWYE